MVRIYRSIRAFHRISSPDQQDYYRRLLAENSSYWEPVQLRNGSLVDKTDRSKVAKLARQRRYRRAGRAVYLQKYWDRSHMDAEDLDEEDMEREEQEDMEREEQEDMDCDW